MLKIQSNSRQVPKVQDICANKKYFDILYSYLQCISQKDIQNDIRYVLKKDINFVAMADIFNLSRQTVSKRFKNLIEIGLIAEFDKDKYQIITLDNNIASLVPYQTLKLLIDTLNDNCVSTYIYFLNRYYANKQQPFQFTIDQIKSFLGISTTTRSNNETITNILYVLEKIGLIKYSFENSGMKTIYTLNYLTNIVC